MATPLTRYADVESVWVRLRYGSAASVVLMNTDGSTSVLRGAEMFSWLRDWSLQYKIRPEDAYRSRASQLRLFARSDEGKGGKGA